MPRIDWKTGVYTIQNLRNKKIYVGSAATSLRQRWNFHSSKLERGIHENRYLQNAWKKYGKNAFVFTIIEKCSPKECLEKEQYWIDTLQACDRSCGYNICPIARSRLGVKESDKTREKVSNAMKDLWKDKAYLAHMVRVHKFQEVNTVKRIKTSLALRRRKNTLKQNQALIKANRDRVWTERMRKKVSESVKKYYRGD